ncbi:hypothetical protein HANVADRAFT_91979 [Hanseniaspora valbyensis NRRL Y-1626]|uniref:Uncharacterized protein n=1 Tax=Hanseniaspora valbyensis NRRL Y-1626 TaxID=766949 RepID=A0A1B7TII9_9ASCO|nr:hypothetical protein HANVADRAFT_91979 [Hanseniaspora valbyensis NRRL Y-1626]
MQRNLLFSGFSNPNSFSFLNFGNVCYGGILYGVKVPIFFFLDKLVYRQKLKKKISLSDFFFLSLLINKKPEPSHCKKKKKKS